MNNTASIMHLGIAFAVMLLFSGKAASESLPPIKAPVQTVVDMPGSELLHEYGDVLSSIDIAEDDVDLADLLQRAGERVETFFRDFSNIAAGEHVVMEKRMPDNKGIRYENFGITEINLLPAQFRSQRVSTHFNYIILPRLRNGEFQFLEYRTDRAGREIDARAASGSFIMSRGYAGLCLYLHPAHQNTARFRYVGREKKASRAHVIAFSQKPEFASRISQDLEINQWNPIRYLVQGFVWLDSANNQILRIRTMMQEPERKSILSEQITDVLYGKVEFDQGRRQLWLPEDVKVSWRLPGWVYQNRHRYSKYRLFAVQTDLKIGQQQMPHHR